MKHTDTILTSASRTFDAPAMARSHGVKSARFTVKVQAYHIPGNSHPHFSVTAELVTPDRCVSNPILSCGCLHDDAARFWPSIKPIIALHLSNADDGEPMHAEADGWYWLAGALGGMGEEYHGGSGSDGKTPEQCLAILASHLRITPETAHNLSLIVQVALEPRKVFAEYVDAQRARWREEAESGIRLIPVPVVTL